LKKGGDLVGKRSKEGELPLGKKEEVAQRHGEKNQSGRYVQPGSSKGGRTYVGKVFGKKKIGGKYSEKTRFVSARKKRPGGGKKSKNNGKGRGKGFKGTLDNRTGKGGGPNPISG